MRGQQHTQASPCIDQLVREERGFGLIGRKRYRRRVAQQARAVLQARDRRFQSSDVGRRHAPAAKRTEHRRSP